MSCRLAESVLVGSRMAIHLAIPTMRRVVWPEREKARLAARLRWPMGAVECMEARVPAPGPQRGWHDLAGHVGSTGSILLSQRQRLARFTEFCAMRQICFTTSFDRKGDDPMCSSSTSQAVLNADRTNVALFLLLGQEKRNRPRRLRSAHALYKTFGLDPLMDRYGIRMHWIGRLRPVSLHLQPGRPLWNQQTCSS